MNLALKLGSGNENYSYSKRNDKYGKMPKKKRKIEKITIESDSDDNYDFIRPKKKGCRVAFFDRE